MALFLLACCLLSLTLTISSFSGLRRSSSRRSRSLLVRRHMGGAEDVLKRGILQGLEGSDALWRARSLASDPTVAAEASLRGSAVLTNIARSDVMAGNLEKKAGAILVSLSSDSYEGKSLLRNPRDDRYAMTGSSVDSLVSAVALGLARCAVISAPAGLEAQRVVRAVSWAGTTAIGADVGGDYVFLVGSSLADVLPLAEALGLCDVDSSSGDSSKVTFSSSKNPLFYPSGAVCEPAVVTSISVLSDVLRKTSAPAASATAADVLICPATPVASQLAGSAALRAVAEGEQSCSADSLHGRVCVLIPCGVVCDEDDGYGSAEGGEGDREGLPIGAVLHATAASLQQLLRLAAAFERGSRWSSELFAAAASREQAKDDLDDARESFGIFFTSTLIKYIGKKVIK